MSEKLADLAQAELADIVLLKKPFASSLGRQGGGPFRFGIVAEVVARLPDGRVRNVGLYLYDPVRKEISVGLYNTPEVVDFHCSRFVLYKRATGRALGPDECRAAFATEQEASEFYDCLVGNPDLHHGCLDQEGDEWVVCWG
jgi:hypothetical protein